MREVAPEWEGFRAVELAEHWAVPAVHLFRRLGSTNDAARELAVAGAATGTVVLAEEQLAGRGQAGRAWASAPGLGVWMSVVLRPADLPNPALLPLLAGLGVAEALSACIGGCSLALKWPNDLLAGDSKVAGLLCEAVWDGTRPAFVIAGVGVNVLHEIDDFEPGLRGCATSLRLAAGGPVSRFGVATAVVRGVNSGAAETGHLLSETQLRRLRGRDALVDREVAVLGSGVADGTGTALGIAPDGALLVRAAGGTARQVHRGSVRLVPTGVLA